MSTSVFTLGFELPVFVPHLPGQHYNARAGRRVRCARSSAPSSRPSERFLTDTLGLFQDRFPGVKLSLSDREPYESIARLKERELDLALVFDFDHWSWSTDYEGRIVCRDSEIECIDLSMIPSTWFSHETTRWRRASA